MNVQKTKTVDATVEAQRAVAMLNGVYGVGMFVILLGIPILNLIIGFLVLVSLAAPIFTRSNRIGVDLGWLLIGTVLCLVGMLAYPVLPMLNYTPPWPAVFLGALLRAVVFWWIVQNKLGHLYGNQQGAAQV
ncbi:lipopolysaccharide export LptBFGC system permease protein LptF [Robbsia andropogonis]|uniref:hypothetical protein n=1 Tax=Robbsia andropogonis TaxID=28092 RepID=UPI003D248FF9